jgi:hypothetical protein
VQSQAANKHTGGQDQKTDGEVDAAKAALVVRRRRIREVHIRHPWLPFFIERSLLIYRTNRSIICTFCTESGFVDHGRLPGCGVPSGPEPALW